MADDRRLPPRRGGARTGGAAAGTREGGGEGAFAGEDAATCTCEAGAGGVVRGGKGSVAWVVCVTRIVGCVTKVWGEEVRPAVPEDG